MAKKENKIHQMEFNKSEVQILSASDIEEKDLFTYYRKTFPHRRNSLPIIWKWLNYSEYYSNQIPIILRYKSEIIGHIGLRPVKLRVNNNIISAGWPIDFRVDQNYRNQGLGILLSNKLQSYAKIHLAFPNENSYPLFKKIGWVDGGRIYTHFLPIRPLDHPRFYRKIPAPLINFFNFLIKPYFTRKIKRFSGSEFQIMNISSTVLDEFADLRAYNDENFTSVKKILPQRGKEYLKWRILESPNVSKYCIFSIDNTRSIVLMNNNRGKYIDILSVSDCMNVHKIFDLIMCICSFASDNSYSYVRLCSTNDDLSNLIKRNISTHVKEYRFSYFTEDEDLKSQISDSRWYWELIDSDFEYMEPSNKVLNE